MSDIKRRKRRRPKAFLRRYGRVLIGASILGVIVLLALLAPVLARFDPNQTDMALTKAPPSAEHWFGTDIYGRDLFARVIYGARITLLVAFGVQVLAVALGALCGLLSGYYHRVDTVLTRIMEGLAAMPQLLLAMVITSVLGPGPFKMILSLVICSLPAITRMVRGQVLSLREKEFIESEKAMGASGARTIFRHILPHCSSYLLIRFNTGLSSTVLTLASLSYMGVGLDPSIPNWGAIIADGQGLMMLYVHLVLSPGLAICITVFACCMLGDGLRDILDPKYR